MLQVLLFIYLGLAYFVGAVITLLIIIMNVMPDRDEDEDEYEDSNRLARNFWLTKWWHWVLLVVGWALSPILVPITLLWVWYYYL